MPEITRQIGYDTSASDNVLAQYATHMVVQHTEHEFVLTFYAVVPPVIVGSEEQVAKRIEQLEHAPTQCVARIVIAASRMPEFVKVMQKNLAHYQSMIKRTPSDTPDLATAASEGEGAVGEDQ